MASETWALLSDVHGNLPALERALDQAASEGADRFAFLGDALGVPEQDEACCRLLMEQASVAVFGNREMRLRLPYSEDVVEWLRSLPATRAIAGALLCHSSPASAFPSDIRARDALMFRRSHSYWDLFPYVSGKASVHAAAGSLEGLGLRTAFFGHTHRQDAWQVAGGEGERLRESRLMLGDAVTLVGVGTVGKGEGGSVQYALWRPDERSVRLVSLASGGPE